MEKFGKKDTGRKEYEQESAKVEQAKGKKGFAHPTSGYEAKVSQG